MTKQTLQDIADMIPGQKKMTVKKGTILLQQGEKCKFSYRVMKGCLKSFVIDGAGKEHILQFAPENWFISDLDSFLNNNDAMISIDAIEDTEVIVYDQQMPAAHASLPNEFLISGIKAMQNNIIAINKRLIHLLSSTAEERYLDFIRSYPSLLQRLPLKLIASYVGVTPESLSRIRKNLVKKQ